MNTCQTHPHRVPQRGGGRGRPPFVEAAEGRLPLWVRLTGVQASSTQQQASKQTSKQASKQTSWQLPDLIQILGANSPPRIHALIRLPNPSVTSGCLLVASRIPYDVLGAPLQFFGCLIGLSLNSPWFLFVHTGPPGGDSERNFKCSL